MKGYESLANGKIHILRLDQGEDLLKGIEA